MAEDFDEEFDMVVELSLDAFTVRLLLIVRWKPTDKASQSQVVPGFHPRFDQVAPTDGHETRHDLWGRDWLGVTWRAIQFDSKTSSTHFTALHPPPYPSPPKTTCSSTDSSLLSSPDRSTPDLRLGHYLASGRLSDTFTAHLGPSSQPVVIKLTDLDTFSPLEEPDAYNLASATAAVRKEIELYLTHLKRLQGVLVPTSHKIYIGQSVGMRTVVMMVLEDVGKALGDDWQGIPLATRYVEQSFLPNLLPSY